MSQSQLQMLYVTVQDWTHTFDFGAISPRHRSGVVIVRCKRALTSSVCDTAASSLPYQMYEFCPILVHQASVSTLASNLSVAWKWLCNPFRVMSQRRHRRISVAGCKWALGYPPYRLQPSTGQDVPKGPIYTKRQYVTQFSLIIMELLQNSLWLHCGQWELCRNHHRSADITLTRMLRVNGP